MTPISFFYCGKKLFTRERREKITRERSFLQSLKHERHYCCILHYTHAKRICKDFEIKTAMNLL